MCLTGPESECRIQSQRLRLALPSCTRVHACSSSQREVSETWSWLRAGRRLNCAWADLLECARACSCPDECLPRNQPQVQPSSQWLPSVLSPFVFPSKNPSNERFPPPSLAVLGFSTDRSSFLQHNTKTPRIQSKPVCHIKNQGYLNRMKKSQSTDARTNVKETLESPDRGCKLDKTASARSYEHT